MNIFKKFFCDSKFEESDHMHQTFEDKIGSLKVKNLSSIFKLLYREYRDLYDMVAFDYNRDIARIDTYDAITFLMSPSIEAINGCISACREIDQKISSPTEMIVSNNQLSPHEYTCRRVLENLYTEKGVLYSLGCTLALLNTSTDNEERLNLLTVSFYDVLSVIEYLECSGGASHYADLQDGDIRDQYNTILFDHFIKYWNARKELELKLIKL